jgi:hypothetical protein
MNLSLLVYLFHYAGQFLDTNMKPGLDSTFAWHCPIRKHTNVLLYEFQYLCSLEKMGALNWAKVVHEHQGWRLISCIWLHAGLVHLVVNMLSLLFIGIRLEQQFGFGKLLTCTCWFTLSLEHYLYFPVLAPWLDPWLSIIFQHRSALGRCTFCHKHWNDTSKYPARCHGAVISCRILKKGICTKLCNLLVVTQVQQNFTWKERFAYIIGKGLICMCK